MQWLVKIVLVYVLVSGSLAQSSSEICADAPDMSYVASLENCSWYYQCILNVAHRLACSFGLHFSQVAQTCDLPDRANCQIVTTPMPTTSTPSTTPMYTECEGLQDGTLLPNPNSCLSFYECINELPYPRFCDDGLWFDMNLLACGPPDSVNCTPTMPSTTEYPPTPPILPTVICLEARNDTWVRNPLKCEGFFHCLNFFALERTCPEGLWFNFNQQRCTQKFEAFCILEDSLCAGIEEMKVIRSATSCTDVIVCEDGMFIESFFCRDGYWFDEERQICDQEANVDCDLETPTPLPPRSVCDGVLDYLLARSPDSCSDYYVCVNNEPRHSLSCPEGQWFDVQSQACQNSGVVECELD